MEIEEVKRFRVGERTFNSKESAQRFIDVSSTRERLDRLCIESNNNLPSFNVYTEEILDNLDLYIKAVRPDWYDELCDMGRINERDYKDFTR